MLTLLTALLVSVTAHAGELEDAINGKVTASTVFCSATALGGLNIACDGEDIYRGNARMSAAMKLLIQKGLKPISCNYSVGGQNASDASYCALSK